MTVDTTSTNPTSLLDVEYPISATEVKPLGQFTEEDCYTLRKTLEFTQPELAAAFTLLEVELGQQPACVDATVAGLRPQLVRDVVGHAPTPRPVVGANR